jgi:hypothetical protein
MAQEIVNLSHEGVAMDSHRCTKARAHVHYSDNHRQEDMAELGVGFWTVCRVNDEP